MCSIQTVADMIRQDAAMSAKVLHLVNTAFYGIRQEISDIRIRNSSPLFWICS